MSCESGDDVSRIWNTVNNYHKKRPSKIEMISCESGSHAWICILLDQTATVAKTCLINYYSSILEMCNNEEKKQQLISSLVET